MGLPTAVLLNSPWLETISEAALGGQEMMFIS